jgi:hypothetical protein
LDFTFFWHKIGQYKNEMLFRWKAYIALAPRLSFVEFLVSGYGDARGILNYNESMSGWLCRNTVVTKTGTN